MAEFPLARDRHQQRDSEININKFVIMSSIPLDKFQGHPMDLFLKISVLHANFCWLGDVEEIIVLGRKVLLGKT